jgi:hypothetical protein
MGSPIYWIRSMADSKFELLKGQLRDPRWRLSNLYWITDKNGDRIQFKMNWAQENLMNDLHYCNVILKARQLGFTTFIQIFMLDQCIFNSNIRAGTIAHRLDDARTIFRDKIRYPYDNLPEALRNARPLLSDSAEELVLANNSSIRVGTSLRSGTLQYLHISEYGKLCAQFADKAREVRTGALNTLQAGQVVFIESTAEGKEGHFFEMCETAQAKQRMDTRLTPLDFKFHFYPWWREPSYELDPEGVTIGDDLRKYFEKLESCDGIQLSDRKRAWYSKKCETQLEDMKREYPSTPEEAFEASIEEWGRVERTLLMPSSSECMAHNVGRMPALINPQCGSGPFPIPSAWRREAKCVGSRSSQAAGEGLPFYVDILEQYRVLITPSRWRKPSCKLPVHTAWDIGRWRRHLNLVLAEAAGQDLSGWILRGFRRAGSLKTNAAPHATTCGGGIARRTKKKKAARVFLYRVLTPLLTRGLLWV